MYINGQNAARYEGAPGISLRCPYCKHQGFFTRVANLPDASGEVSGLGQVFVGVRMCPNTECFAEVFVVHRGNLILSYPSERLDFDTSGIPSNVTSAFEEAITCHSDQCFIASAIMVRKTLEELCRDRNADGPNLKKRLETLSEKVVLPTELLTGLDELRLLGNDAAHVESQEYAKIGKEEVEIGIMFTKEVLKAVYQYSTLLTRLKGFKKQP